MRARRRAAAAPSCRGAPARSDPAFMEEMQKAMADPSLMGALASMGGAPGAAGSDEEDGDE